MSKITLDSPNSESCRIYDGVRREDNYGTPFTVTDFDGNPKVCQKVILGLVGP